MRAYNLTRNTSLAAEGETADTFLSRMQGLLGRASFPPGQGLLITRCNSIHMFFMKFPIDVVFLSSADRVVGLVERIPPFGVSPVFWKSVKALELPAGVIQATGTALNDHIVITDKA